MESIYWQGKGMDGKIYTITHMEYTNKYALWKNKTCKLPNLIKSGYASLNELKADHPDKFDTKL